MIGCGGQKARLMTQRRRCVSSECVLCREHMCMKHVHVYDTYVALDYIRLDQTKFVMIMWNQMCVGVCGRACVHMRTSTYDAAYCKLYTYIRMHQSWRRRISRQNVFSYMSLLKMSLQDVFSEANVSIACVLYRMCSLICLCRKCLCRMCALRRMSRQHVFSIECVLLYIMRIHMYASISHVFSHICVLYRMCFLIHYAHTCVCVNLSCVLLYMCSLQNVFSYTLCAYICMRQSLMCSLIYVFSIECVLLYIMRIHMYASISHTSDYT